MVEVLWTDRALADLEHNLFNAASLAGARRMRAAVEVAVTTIATFPYSGRRDPETQHYEAVLKGVPLLLIYDVVAHTNGLRAEIIAVFNTRRDPKRKPRHRR